MIAVILADHDIAHRLIGDGFDFFSNVARVWLAIACIDQHHALMGDDDHGIGIIALADIGIDILRQFDEFRLLSGDGSSRSGPDHKGGKDEGAQHG